MSFESRKLENPGKIDVNNVKRTLRYLRKTKEKGIVYEETENLELIAYSDADFAGDTETRRSTSGYVIFFSGGPLSWCSRRQPIVSLSSTEAEYISAAECVKETLFLKYLLEEMFDQPIPVTLRVDNQSAIRLAETGKMNRRSKHIDVRYYFISERIKDKSIYIEYCPTDDQVADILTKPLDRLKFTKFRNSLLKEL